MSGTDQLISLGAEEPEFYAELLSNIRRPPNWRLLTDGQSWPTVPGIQNVHDALSRRLYTLLDAVADISLCQRGNVSATMASLKDNGGALETRLYIVFSHEDDKSYRRCSQHLQHIFNLLHRVSYTGNPAATGSSPKTIGNEFDGDYIEICRVIHDYSFDIFYHRLTKRGGKISEIRRYIEKDPDMTEKGRALSVFREPLLLFLDNMDQIIKITKAEATKPLSDVFMKILVRFYLYWTHNLFLPKHSADNRITWLDRADEWLTQYHPINFQLRRWALKTMSFVISANRLFILTQSNRLHWVVHGNFSVQVLSSPATTPYCCPLSTETARTALDAAVAKTGQIPSGDWDNKLEWFFQQLLGKTKEPFDATHWKPRVHAELAMIIAMAKGEIKDVLPYVGVSKLSCTMCSHYIGAFNEIWNQKIVTKGSHWKAYPGWAWPSLPDHDEELRQSFLGRVREQLYSDFMKWAGRRLSDSSVGSDGPKLETTGYDMDETYDLIKRNYK